MGRPVCEVGALLTTTGALALGLGVDFDSPLPHALWPALHRLGAPSPPHTISLVCARTRATAVGLAQLAGGGGGDRALTAGMGSMVTLPPPIASRRTTPATLPPKWSASNSEESPRSGAGRFGNSNFDIVFDHLS